MRGERCDITIPPNRIQRRLRPSARSNRAVELCFKSRQVFAELGKRHLRLCEGRSAEAFLRLLPSINPQDREQTGTQIRTLLAQGNCLLRGRRRLTQCIEGRGVYLVIKRTGQKLDLIIKHGNLA